MWYARCVPAVWRERGIDVVIYPNDHPPPHVHCFIAGTEVILLLDPEVTVHARKGMREQDVRRARALVRERLGFLSTAWRRWHP